MNSLTADGQSVAPPEPLPFDAPPADVLERAADIIEANGRHVGALWDLNGFVPWAPAMPVCTVAAIGVALGQRTAYNVHNYVIPCALEEARQDEPPHPAMAALMEYLGAPAVQHVFVWSDEHEAPEIAAVMRECAASLRAVTA